MKSSALAVAEQPRQEPSAELDELAHLVHRLGTELPALDASLSSAQSSEVALEVAKAHAALVEAARVLEQARRAHTRQQRARLARRAKAAPLKLNLAAGEQQLPGWVNLDAQHGALRYCLQWPLPLPSRSVSHAYFAHGLEHLYLETEAMPLLCELRRVLRPSATLRIVVPDLGALCEAYVAGDDALFAARREIWAWERECRSALEQVLTYAGANTLPHGFFCHKFGYDFQTLAILLRRAGFRRVRRSEFMASRHAALRIDDTSEAGMIQVNGRHLSLFVEASP